jgi:hypothetical protein
MSTQRQVSAVLLRQHNSYRLINPLIVSRLQLSEVDPIDGLSARLKHDAGCNSAVLASSHVWGPSPRHLAVRLVAGFPPRRLGFKPRPVHMGFVCGQSGTGAGFLRVLQFPLPILLQPNGPHSPSSTTRGWYNRPKSGRRTKWTQSHPTPRN